MDPTVCPTTTTTTTTIITTDYYIYYTTQFVPNDSNWKLNSKYNILALTYDSDSQRENLRPYVDKLEGMIYSWRKLIAAIYV